MDVSEVSCKRKNESGNNTLNKSWMRGTLYNHGAKNMAAKEFPQAMKVSFMSKPMFNAWRKGLYHKKIDKENFNIVISFINQFEKVFLCRGESSLLKHNCYLQV